MDEECDNKIYFGNLRESKSVQDATIEFRNVWNVHDFSTSRINHGTHRDLEARIHEVVPSGDNI